MNKPVRSAGKMIERPQTTPKWVKLIKPACQPLVVKLDGQANTDLQDNLNP